MFGALSTLLLVCLQTSFCLEGESSLPAAAATSRDLVAVSSEVNYPGRWTFQHDHDPEHSSRTEFVSTLGNSLDPEKGVDESHGLSHEHKEIDNAIKEIYYSDGKPISVSENREWKQVTANTKEIYSKPRSNSFTTEKPDQPFQIQETIPQNAQIDNTNQESSMELLQGILTSNGENVNLQSKNIPIENAYLTKTVTYNVTKLSGNNQNNEYHLETKWNHSTDIKYYDSRERLTNYSDKHSSMLQRILGGGHRNKPSHQVLSGIYPTHDTQSIQIPINNSSGFQILLNSPTTILRAEPSPALFGERQFVNRPITEDNMLLGQPGFGGEFQPYDDFVGGQYIKSGGKDKMSHISNVEPSKPYDDFVGGQYIKSGGKDKMSHISNVEPSKPYDDFVGGQYIESTGGKDQMSHTSNVEPSKPYDDFVGGQYIEGTGGKDKMSHTSNVEPSKPYDDFVGGQYIESTGGKDQMSHTSNVEPSKPYDDFVGGQYFESTGGKDQMSHTSNVEPSKPYDDFVGGQYIEGTGGKDKMSHTSNVEPSKPYDGFVGGQYFESTGGKDQMSHTSNVEPSKPYDDFVGGQYIEGTGGKDKMSHTPNVESSEFVGQQYIDLSKQPQENKVSPTYFHSGQFIDGEHGIGTVNLDESNNLLSVSNNHSYNGNETYLEVLSILGNEPDTDNLTETFTSLTEFINSTSQTEGSIVNTVQNLKTGGILPGTRAESKSNKGVEKQTGRGEYSQNETFLSTQSEELENVISNSVIDDSSGGIGQNQGIFLEDPETGGFVTEIVEAASSQETTEEVNIVTMAGTSSKSVEAEGELEGEPSNLLPNNILPNVTDNRQNVFENSQENISKFNNSNESSEHSVELYAGNREENYFENITIEPKVSYRLNKSDPFEIGNPDEQSSIELCFPLPNKKHNISLLDLLSGNLIIEVEGRKIPIYLQDTPLKYCNSGTGKCKLYVNFDKPLQLQNDSAVNIKLIENLPNEKRQVDKRGIEWTKSEFRAERSTEEFYFRSKDSTKGNPNQGGLDHVLTEASSEKTLKQKLKVRRKNYDPQYAEKETSSELPLRFNLQIPLQKSNRISKKDHNNIMPTYTENRDYILPYNLNNKKVTLQNMDSVDHNSGEFRRSPDTLNWLKISQKRPARTVHTSKSENRFGSVTDCGCSSNLLQNPSPTPSYAHFVNKRWDILTNIVHTVKKWAIEN